MIVLRACFCVITVVCFRPKAEGRIISATEALKQLRNLKLESVAEIRKTLAEAIPGKSYPTYSKVPKTSFSCDHVPQPGYYADVEAECQLYHRCDQDHEYMYSFLCPNKTLFNQITLVCDWFYNVDCSKTQAFYSYSNPRLLPYSGNFLDDELTTPNGAPVFEKPVPNNVKSNGEFDSSHDFRLEDSAGETKVVYLDTTPSSFTGTTHHLGSTPKPVSTQKHALESKVTFPSAASSHEPISFSASNATVDSNLDDLYWGDSPMGIDSLPGNLTAVNGNVTGLHGGTINVTLFASMNDRNTSRTTQTSTFPEPITVSLRNSSNFLPPIQLFTRTFRVLRPFRPSNNMLPKRLLSSV